MHCVFTMPDRIFSMPLETRSLYWCVQSDLQDAHEYVTVHNIFFLSELKANNKFAVSLSSAGQTIGPRGFDINVGPVWRKNITGRGVVVTILDDGIEYTHPDLRNNYEAKASWDFNSHDSDPMPRYSRDNLNKHGTRYLRFPAINYSQSVFTVGLNMAACWLVH